MDERDREIERLNRMVAEMQLHTSKSELARQSMREIQFQLDTQIDMFTRIHSYAQRAFHASGADELCATIAEGVVDIFQTELGAVCVFDLAEGTLQLLGSCNLDNQAASIPLDAAWLARGQLQAGRAMWASYGEDESEPDAPWASLELAHVVYMPLINNNREVEGLVLGGITRGSARFYDFAPQEMLSGFMVYIQQMNGIYNNVRAIQEVREAGQAKSRFLANLSHEIRTPMNAIIGMAQIAERSNDLKEHKKCIAQISVSSRHLLGLINDVLDISKIEEGKLSLSEAPFRMHELVDDLLVSIRPMAEAKSQHLEISIDSAQSLRVLGDSMRLSQVLMNLLSNAVKFTPEGGHIALDIEVLSIGAEESLVRFSVSDTGIGIDKAFSERLFKPFEQQDSGTSRRYGGTGLGLAISQRIVELMGSQIKVESTPGEGSLFWFTAWLKVDQSQAMELAGNVDIDVADFTGRTMLIVDDVDINREIIMAFLEGSGMAFECAENGRQAVDMVAASEAYHYDVILMDMQMPVMDGCDATRAIRALPRQDARDLQILAMTANVFKEDVRMVIEAGMNGHIGKPVEYSLLINAIQKAVDVSGKRRIH